MDLEAVVREIRQRRDACLAGGMSTASMAEYQRFQAELLDAERAWSLSRGEETATALPWPLRWTNSSRVCLFYSPRREVDFYYDRCLPRAAASDAVVQVRLVGAYAVKTGGPNDEVIEGHPLFGRGIEAYGAFEIAHSSWLREIETINNVHPQYDPAYWKSYRHLVFLFHDDQIEAITRDVKTTLHTGPLEDVVRARFDASLSR